MTEHSTEEQKLTDFYTKLDNLVESKEQELSDYGRYIAWSVTNLKSCMEDLMMATRDQDPNEIIGRHAKKAHSILGTTMVSFGLVKEDKKDD